MASNVMNGHWETFSLKELMAEVCEPLVPRFSAQAIQTVIDVPPYHVVTADRELLRRAVLNLVLGALDAMPTGGLLTAISTFESGGIELEIADTGPALSDEQRQQIFDLNSTFHRRGTGWGLAVVRRIAELLGGNVTTANCPDGGVAFTLRIPRAAALEAAA